LVAESDLNDPRLLWPPERGGVGFAAQWSDGRAREFAGFGWKTEEVPDPQELKTYECSS
jgi:hypothetical protein